ATRWGLGRWNRISTTGASAGPGFVVGTQAELLSNRTRRTGCGSSANPHSTSRIPSLPLATCTCCKASLPGSWRETETVPTPAAGQKRQRPEPSGAALGAKTTPESRASTVNLPLWSIGVHRHFPGVLAGTAVAVTTGMATIAALEPDARPRERLTARGAEHLTDGELLAIVLGAGTRGASALDIAGSGVRGGGGPA